MSTTYTLSPTLKVSPSISTSDRCTRRPAAAAGAALPLCALRGCCCGDGLAAARPARVSRLLLVAASVAAPSEASSLGIFLAGAPPCRADGQEWRQGRSREGSHQPRAASNCYQLAWRWHGELTLSFLTLVLPAFWALVKSVMWLCRRPPATGCTSSLRLVPALGPMSARSAALQLPDSSISDGQCPE